MCENLNWTFIFARLHGAKSNRDLFIFRRVDIFFWEVFTIFALKFDNKRVRKFKLNTQINNFEKDLSFNKSSLSFYLLFYIIFFLFKQICLKSRIKYIIFRVVIYKIINFFIQFIIDFIYIYITISTLQLFHKRF